MGSGGGGGSGNLRHPGIAGLYRMRVDALLEARAGPNGVRLREERMMR